MEELGLIRDLAVVWLTALVAGAICTRIRTPPMVGYIAAGVFLGPFGAGLIGNVEHIRVLSEMGVALLLFALGVELSLKHIFASAHRTVVAGLLQVILTVVIAGIFASTLGITVGWKSAMVFGFMTALSSTALVTKLIVDRGEAETSHANMLISILLLQDLCLIPVVALLPTLNGAGDSIAALAWALGKAALLVIVVVFGATWFTPRLLNAVVKANSRELFILTVISLCLVVALLGHHLGLSLALGAFLAGITVSERPYGQQVLADIMPLRDLFATLFFVSVGLLLQPNFIAANLGMVAAFVTLITIGKAAIAWVALSVATKAKWTAALTSVGLAQVGEFSFVLATLATAQGLISDSAYNLFFAGAVISLFLSPALIAMAPKLLMPFMSAQKGTTPEILSEPEAGTALSGHVVLCGFGRMGRHVGLSLASYGIPLVVVEVSPEAADELRTMGIPHVYGDAFSPMVLARAGAARAACVIMAIPDPVVTLNAIDYVRTHNTEAKVIVRAHHLEDADALRVAGASAIVQPEFEASLELLKLAMVAMQRSNVEIELASKDLRRYAHLLFQPDLRTHETL